MVEHLERRCIASLVHLGHLQALHQFSEELREATGATSLYNQSLGTVSDRYTYDRVENRDLPEAQRPQRAWEGKKKDTGRKPA